MRNISYFAGFFSILLYTSYLFSGTIDPNTPDSKYLEYGSKFDYVVRLCCVDSDSQKACGSAVLIDKNWAITAAHVVDHCSDWTIIVKNKAIKIDEVMVNPNYDANVFGRGDIALCYIKAGVDLDFFPSLYEEDREVGKVCSIAGWGITGTFYTGATVSDNRIRAGSNIVDSVANDRILVCSPSRTGQRKTELEFLIASGDSGGGLFIDQKLAGINSSVMAIDKKPDSTYTDESCHTRVSHYMTWIKETIKKRTK